jgi:hypothetical protein
MKHNDRVTHRFALALGCLLATMTLHAEQPGLPQLGAKLSDTHASHAFLSSAHLKRPLDLSRYGYVEEEYLISGQARVFDWPDGARQKVLAQGPYTTRILIRRPKDSRHFNGAVIVEPFNPSSPVDLPIMWAESHQQMLADGYAWVGLTIKPNTIKALKQFDAARYASVAMPNPLASPRCEAAEINAWSQPTTPADETGLAWDILSQLGRLLKEDAPVNPLGQPAQRLYMTGQSQTAGYARTYATVFGKTTVDGKGKPLYDAYLYSGSPPWQVPLHQCMKDLPAGDSRLITAAVGVPIIELFAQGDIGTNIETRRADADARDDRFRRYEIAGAAHTDPWEELSFASNEDMRRIGIGGAGAARDVCTPENVTPSDFPIRYVFNAAWRNLDKWVRQGVAPPRAPRLELKVNAGEPFAPDKAFVEDALGNAKGGVRTPYVDVPTARWVGARAGPFRCLFSGYKVEFDEQKLASLYNDHGAYVKKVRASASRLESQRWLTAVDAAAIVREAEARTIAARGAAPRLMTQERYAEYLRLFNNGDDRYADLYDNDVVFDHGPFYGILRGRQAIVDFYRDIRTQMQETVTATEVIIDHEQGVMAAELSTELRAIRDGVKLASRTLNKGDVYTTRGVVIYGLKDGRIVSIRGAVGGTSFEGGTALHPAGRGP